MLTDPAAVARSPDLPLLANLNPEQLAAVTLPEGNALILAGAGSGKTRVLTTRIAWLLQTGQVSPGGVLAVTFTNKAAKEMMTRLAAMLPVNVRGMWIGTFHGLCNRLLRAHWKLANLPSTFQILDTQDQLSAIKRLMKQFNVDEERFPAKQTQWFIAGAKEDGLRPRDVETRSEDDRKKVELYQLYEEQCQREGVVDFGELMLRSYELLRDNDAVREHYQRRFRHILIDEFQDTNRLQYAWIKMFSGATVDGRFVPGGNSVIAVGDDDQSIYAFRGARVGNMADFVREFEVQHQIKLEQNYRSFGNILDSANELISHNKKRLGKNLRTEQGPGEPVRVYESTSDFAEAQWMVEEMRQLVRDGIAAQRDRGALPQQCAKPRDRNGAVQCGRAVPRVRRPALLRARRGQARAGLPAPAREQGRRHELSARRQLPAARHRRAQHRAAAGRGARGRLLAARRGEPAIGQGRRQPGRLRRQDRRAARADAGHVAQGDHRGWCSMPAA